jgi:hypothetical protein
VSPIASDRCEVRSRFTLSLWRDLWRLLRSWWRTDRVRIPLRDGELLQLQIGEVVVIRGSVVRITGRRVVRSSARVEVVYECATETEHGSMSISIENDRPAESAIWQTGNLQETVVADEILITDSQYRRIEGCGNHVVRGLIRHCGGQEEHRDADGSHDPHHGQDRS